MSSGGRYDYKELMMTIINSYNKKQNDQQLTDYNSEDRRPTTEKIRFRLTKLSYKDLKKKEQTRKTIPQLDFISTDRLVQLSDIRQKTPAPNAYDVAAQFHALNKKTPMSIHERLRYYDDNNPNISPQTYKINPEITRFGRKPYFYTRVYWEDSSSYW